MSTVTKSVPANDLDRKLVTFDDGEEGRIYYNDLLPNPMPSATTVLKSRIDPDKEEGLDGWRDWFDGSTKRRSPHHSDQLAYKGFRGTLGHFAILKQLDPSMEETLEERHAKIALKHWEKTAPEDGSGGLYDGEHAWDKCMRDINWICSEWPSVADEYGITQESTITAEEYVYLNDNAFLYAGQFDLLYENEDGETVLADLKTSSGIRTDYKLQLAGYAYACDYDIDRLQVLRLYPDKQEIEVESDEDWDRSIQGLQYEFLSLAEKTVMNRMHSFVSV